MATDGQFGELTQLLIQTAKIKQSHFQHHLECASEHLDINTIAEALGHVNHRGAGTHSTLEPHTGTQTLHPLTTLSCS